MTSFLLGLKKYRNLQICQGLKDICCYCTVCHIIYSGCFSSSACLYRSLFVFETSTCTHTYIIPLHHLPRFQYKHTHMQWITRPSEYFLCPPPPLQRHTLWRYSTTSGGQTVKKRRGREEGYAAPSGIIILCVDVREDVEGGKVLWRASGLHSNTNTVELCALKTWTCICVCDWKCSFMRASGHVCLYRGKSRQACMCSF